ncbi:hypothetical protein Geob_3860 [Geotalea daltonii FRC-32]|uniref:Uncharacterized protein n=1 Tax=Geotalea daltonii (strain DSM 22248 / JCM 15807 / FRC-32) TaxID=316067 RepID=A0A068F117_GEODF|nr:hypothetical protein Geob_3860 [Geotalea daltonii FRC-32]
MPLHKFKSDNILTYILIAIVFTSLLSLGTNHGVSLLGIGMSSTNAIMIRLLEIKIFKLSNKAT